MSGESKAARDVRIVDPHPDADADRYALFILPFTLLLMWFEPFVLAYIWNAHVAGPMQWTALSWRACFGASLCWGIIRLRWKPYWPSDRQQAHHLWCLFWGELLVLGMAYAVAWGYR